MLGAIKAIPEMVKSYRDNRDLVFQAVTGVSAALVATAVASGKRPSDTLAAVAHLFGVTPLAHWMSAGAPPVLAESSSSLQWAALVAALLLVSGMVVVPLWRSRYDDHHVFGYESLRLLGSPAAGTTWVLLLVAAQQGDLGPTLQSWRDCLDFSAVWVLPLLLGAGLLHFLATRAGLGELVRLTWWTLAVMAFRASFGVGAAMLALVHAAVALPLAIVGWMSALESDRSRDLRAEIERELDERAGPPSGAPIVPHRAW